MDDAVRDRLTGLVQEHGVELLQDPARLEAFLRDLCPGSKAEIYCLVAGIREGAVNELRGADPGRSPEAARDHVIQRLSRDLRFDEEAATWTVDTLRAALDAEAQDTPAGDDLDHVGYCASCHAMMSSSADLKTCSECGAALIDVRKVARREEQNAPLIMGDGQDDETEVSSLPPAAAAPAGLPVEEASAVADGRQLHDVASSPPSDVPIGLRAAWGATRDVGSRDAASHETSPAEQPAPPSHRGWRRKHYAIVVAAVVALVVAVALAVAFAASPVGPGLYSEGEMQSAFAINAIDYVVSGSRGWAVGDDGVIFVTNDHGGTWRMQDSGTDLDFRQVVAFTEATCNAYAADNVVWTTVDGGLTWR